MEYKNKEWWEDVIEEEGGNANATGRLYPSEVVDEFDIVIGSWVSKEYNTHKKNQRIRNFLAKKMREQGWHVECSTNNVFDSKIISLTARRRKQ